MQNGPRELYSWEHRSRDLESVLRDLSDRDQDRLGIIGLWHIAYVVPVRTHLGMLSALAKRWHNKTSSFHLPNGEATVTLEDVWHILRLPIHGRQAIYDMDEGRECYIRVLATRDIIYCEGQIELERYRVIAPPFCWAVAAIISDLVSLDR